MTIEALFGEIEDFSFSARVDVASGVDVFLRIAFGQPEVIQLQSCIEEEEGGYLKIWERTLTLCERKVDEQYANPWDAPIAIYLRIVKKNHLDSAYILACVIKTKGNLLWAYQIALDIISEVVSRNVSIHFDVISYSVRQEKNRREYQISSPFGGLTAKPWRHLPDDQLERKENFNRFFLPVRVALNG